MIINALLNETYEIICGVMGDKWCKMCLPSQCDGCVDVELSEKVKITVKNDEPMFIIQYGRKTIRVPRYNCESITIM